MNLQDIKNRLADISVDVEALIEVAGDSPSAEHQEQILALNKEAQGLEAKHDEAKTFEKAKAEIVARRKLAAEAADAPAAGVQPSVSEDLPKKENKMAIPAKARYAKSRHFDNNEDAYESGMFLAAIGGNKKAQDFMAAQSLTNAEGGFSVPQPLWINSSTSLKSTDTRGKVVVELSWVLRLGKFRKSADTRSFITQMRPRQSRKVL